MSTLDTTQALASSNSTTVYMGPALKLNIDESSSTLQLLVNGSYVNVWGKTLQYAFAPQQTTVSLTFTPINGSNPVTASYVTGGTTVVSTPQSGSAVLTIQRPPNNGVSFDIMLEQDTQSFASAIAAPLPAAPPPAQTTSSNTRSSALSSSKVAGLVSPGATSPGTGTNTPSARLQTKLVLTTVEPPPDPDGRPKPPSA